MTDSDFSIFLYGTMLLCCVMAVFSAIKNSKKGLKGLLLSAGFLVFAATTYLYKTHAPELYVRIGCTVLFLLLLGDLFFRMSSPPQGKKR